MKLDELKKGNDKGSNTITPLSQEELHKHFPSDVTEGMETPKEAINKEMDKLNEALFGDAEKEIDAAINNEEKNDVIFDADVDSMDKGLLTEKEIEDVVKDITTPEKEEIAKSETVDIEEPTSDVDQDNFSDMLDDIFDEEDDIEDEIEEKNEDELSDEEAIKIYKEEIDKALSTNTKKKFDLSKFKIRTKPTSVSNVLKGMEEKINTNCADWVLYNSGVSARMSALGALDIETMNPNNLKGSNRLNALKNIYGTLFKHLISENKPATLEEWLKSIKYTDNNNLFFLAYKATFGNSNLISYECPKCHKPTIVQVPIEDCIKYADDETKENVQKLLNQDTTYKGRVESRVVQVTDNLAFSISSPSIYTVLFEYGVLDAKFSQKYAASLANLAYIDAIYQIDNYTQELIPVEIKAVPNDHIKSIKRKVRAYAEILKSLSSEEYTELFSAISEEIKKADAISYVYPKTKCNNCGSEIEEISINPEDMIFTRHQLPIIKTFLND